MTDQVVPLRQSSGMRPPTAQGRVGPAPPLLVFDHLTALAGEYGIYEHAEFDQPRLAEGYTTDDNARVLVLLAGMEEFGDISRRALDFVVSGRIPFGWHNRLSTTGEWRDRRGSDDCHGRALWGLGAVLAAGADDEGVIAAFLAGLDLRSPHLRATCYAALGAVRAQHSVPVGAEAHRFLERLARRMPRPQPGAWKWPEGRLTYANARVPQAAMEVGLALGDDRLVDDGLELLAWLKRLESHDGIFSFTPVAGRGPGELPPAFDQQPLEAWAMADACATAWRVTGDSEWLAGVESAARWFLGENDAGAQMYDAATGAGFDGLEPGGKNLNRGAESTLSALGALAAWLTVRSTGESAHLTSS